MNYEKLYNSIIERSKSRPNPSCYCEKHHIVPRSMGGSDCISNMAILTAREHFIAHWLLKKIYNNKQMIYAFHSMTKPVGNGKKRYTSRSFKYAKEAMSVWLSENRAGSGHPLYGLKGALSPNYGSKRTKETKKILSEIASKRKGLKHPLSKKVVCIETGLVYASISCAIKDHKKGNIYYALKTGGTAGGYTFRYEGSEFLKKINNHRSGSDHRLSVSIVDDKGNIYGSISEAAKVNGLSSPAISAAIKDGRSCKGRVFNRV